MRPAAVTLLALVLLGSCQVASPPSRESILRESYWMASGASDDTTRFAAYAASVTADSSAWKNTLVSWKQTRVLYSSILGQLGYGTGPFTWNYGAREQSALSSSCRQMY